MLSKCCSCTLCRKKRWYASEMKNVNQAKGYSAKFHQFSKWPKSDSCWSLSTGPDGRIYASVCHETVPGGTVKVVRYNEKRDALDFLFDVAEVVNDPGNSGRATQCKIHYSFAPSLEDGLLYCVSHLSGPPHDMKTYSQWRYWHDAKRSFRGAALVVYDPKKDEVIWTDTMIPKEGCRCLALDDRRKLLYAVSYPRDHFIVYSLKDKTARDMGRIGTVNSQAIFIDRKGRAWLINDYGHLVRYDPERDILEESPEVVPHEFYQTGWHSVPYDAVASPDGTCIYIITWNVAPRLLRFWPEEGAFGRMEDLGAVTQKRTLSIPYNMFIDHAGGLVFDNDGQLYFVHSRWFGEKQIMPKHRQMKAEGVLVRLDPQTLKREEIMVLKRPDAIAQYVSRGARDRNGDLFFANMGKMPVGFFRVKMPNRRQGGECHLPLRMWG